MCHHAPDAEVTLVMDESAPRRARQFLDTHWCTTHAHVLRGQAELILAELVSNAVRHGSPPVLVSLECDGDGATLSVSDANPEAGQFRERREGDVALVDLLSDEWGVRTRPGGKTVWSRLVTVDAS